MLGVLISQRVRPQRSTLGEAGLGPRCGRFLIIEMKRNRGRWDKIIPVMKMV